MILRPYKSNADALHDKMPQALRLVPANGPL